jgi:hypothetical protein
LNPDLSITVPARAIWLVTVELAVMIYVNYLEHEKKWAEINV